MIYINLEFIHWDQAIDRFEKKKEINNEKKNKEELGSSMKRDMIDYF